ncbi:hypothetical protein IMSAGC019_00505 [Lachnospiraceae bacterium]|nr:hypothetical protein IMSAGC019_00505 [Lachnospiraceae bacterium]
MGGNGKIFLSRLFEKSSLPVSLLCSTMNLCKASGALPGQEQERAHYQTGFGRCKNPGAAQVIYFKDGKGGQYESDNLLADSFCCLHCH